MRFCVFADAVHLGAQKVSVGARMWPDVCMRGGGVALPLPSEGEAGVQDRLGEQERVGNNE